MGNELSTETLHDVKPSNIANAGSVAIEQSRAVAEAQGQLILAKKFPRDLTKAHAELMDSCKQPSMADSAFYSVPRAGGSVTGPSIRLAEEIARVCGNIEYGHRELSRDAGKSEIEVYAWDKQTNTRSIRQLTVMHTIDTKSGPKPCRDQRDIDDLIANKASKQLRGRILAIVPKWLVEAAIIECQKTISGVNSEKPLSVRARDMVTRFGKFGVTADHIQDYLGHSIDKILLEEIAELQGVFNAIKDGARASDYFKVKEEPVQASSQASLTSAVAAAKLKPQAQPAPVAPQPADEKAPNPEKPKVANHPKVEPVAKAPEVPKKDPVPMVDRPESAEPADDLFF